MGLKLIVRLFLPDCSVNRSQAPSAAKRSEDQPGSATTEEAPTAEEASAAQGTCNSINSSKIKCYKMLAASCSFWLCAIRVMLDATSRWMLPVGDCLVLLGNRKNA
ncbi:unnamed protein product [Polarella glacialis]|uniref:Uncharacterized protein n=1 Tax=Polarella glacialis TaxID=89957 RepID=A0A813FH36_POLGL|nr:unnamed protein product [Polarella glacialis]